jgi:peptidoglycan/LPS O-acetylase OafA/YrhL
MLASSDRLALFDSGFDESAQLATVRKHSPVRSGTVCPLSSKLAPMGLPSPRDVHVDRCVFLDGLRGWGAVTVLVYHYLAEIFPPGPRASVILPRIIFFNGSLAVWVFFVVSGFSLSIGYIRRKDRASLTRLAIGRYPRLAIPIFAACGIVHLMMLTSLIYLPGERPDVLRPFLSFHPSLSRLFRFSLFDVFFNYQPLETYIPPLWTMSLELFGSALVIALLMVFGRVKWRVWGYVLAAIGLMVLNSLYGLFVAGMILAELWHRGASDARWFRSLLAAGFIGGLLVPVVSQTVTPLGMFGVVAWCGAWIFLAPLRRLLETNVSRWLGLISFPLYLMHAPLAYSFSVYLLKQLQSIGFAPANVHLIVGVVSMPVALLAAWLFTRVNEVAVWFSRWFGRATVACAEGVVERRKMNRLRSSFEADSVG